MMKVRKVKPKKEFIERMKLLSKNLNDFGRYKKIIQKPLLYSIRCNTLKISPEKLKKRLEEKGWKINQPFKEHQEIMIVENELLPGELGRSIEHLLGYYYIQEIASMLPVIAINPNSDDKILDLASAPGSKTTQMAAKMKNNGTIIANDIRIERIKILSSNIERCGVSNTIITRSDATRLCNNLIEQNLEFDKILLDAPCSGEGTIRYSPKTALMWNPRTIKYFSKLQKKMIESAFKVLKNNGYLVYSTCTHAPEENERILDYMLKKFKDKIKIIDIKNELPKELKIREGVLKWKDEEYDERVKLCARIYPQDNDSEGFFIAKIKKIK